MTRMVSIASVVREVLETIPHISDSLIMNIVNYSSLARKIVPKVERKLGKKVNVETVIVAIKRYKNSLSRITLSDEILKILSQSTISVKDDIVYLTLDRTSEKVFQNLTKIYEQINWNEGDIMYIVQGIGEIMVVLDEKNVKKFLKIIDEEGIKERFHKNAIITIKSPIESAYVPGVLHFLTEKLAEKEISIELISTPCETHILVDGKDTLESYKILKNLVDRARLMISKK